MSERERKLLEFILGELQLAARIMNNNEEAMLQGHFDGVSMEVEISAILLQNLLRENAPRELG